MKRLTPLVVSSKYKGNITTIEEIDFSQKGIEEIEDLSSCVELKKINLNHNELSSLDGLNFNLELTVINASNNQLTSSALSQLSKLTKLSSK